MKWLNPKNFPGPGNFNDRMASITLKVWLMGYEGIQYTPPGKVTWLAEKIKHEWRCLSYWKMLKKSSNRHVSELGDASFTKAIQVASWGNNEKSQKNYNHLTLLQDGVPGPYYKWMKNPSQYLFTTMVFHRVCWGYNSLITRGAPSCGNYPPWN